MPQIGPDDLWVFIYRSREASYTDLIDAFIETKKCAKQTLLNYKKELEKEGKIQKKISKETKRPVYFVPKEFHQEVGDLADKLEFKEHIDKLTPRQIKKLRKEFYNEFFK